MSGGNSAGSDFQAERKNESGESGADDPQKKMAVTDMIHQPAAPKARDHHAQGHEAGARGVKGVMTGVIAFVFASALATDVMGIHALFGSFLAGVVMPARHEFREFLRLRLEHFSSVFLLPLFFAFVGLRTQVGLLNDTSG